MDLFVYDDDEHPYVPLGVAVAAVVLVVLVSTVVTVVLLRSSDQEADGGAAATNRVTTPSASSVPGPVRTPSALPTTSSVPAVPPGQSGPVPVDPVPGCAEALKQADAVVDRAGRVGQALGAHTRIVDELLAKRLDTEQALDRTLPVLTTGARDLTGLEADRRSYQLARGACPG